MSEVIKWDDKYLIGIDEIDAQHKKWIDIYNRFVIARQEHNEHEVLKEILMEIVDYTKYHFETEEKYMKKYDYPDISKHKDKHNYLIKEISDLILSVNYNEEEAIVTLEKMMKEWILKHILTFDKAFGKYVNKKIAEENK